MCEREGGREGEREREIYYSLFPFFWQAVLPECRGSFKESSVVDSFYSSGSSPEEKVTVLEELVSDLSPFSGSCCRAAGGVGSL